MAATAVRYNNCFAEKWIRDLSPPEWRGRVEVEYVDVPLSSLEHAGSWTDPAVVQGWVTTIRNGGTIPPLVGVLTERGTYYLHDGNHRLEALQEVLGEQSHQLVRIGMAVPQAGYYFVHRQLDGYSTYLIERVMHPIDTVMRAFIAIVLSTVALVATALLPGAERSPFFVLPMFSVIVTAWFAGWKAGVIASVWSLTGCAYYFMSPHGSLLINGPEHMVQFTLLALVMGFAVLFMRYIRLHPNVTLQLSTFWQRRAG
jgi:Domain of unknown function (DUF4118)/ParB-like nuclease domain